MDDKKIRSISEDTLNEVLEILGEDFVNDLPMKPEELLKYAKRRSDPVISDNINYALGQSMLNHRLSDKDYLITFFKIINYVFSGKKPVDAPSASISIAQTGAGKSNLTKKIINENQNTVVVDSDLYKKFRPDVNEILAEDPTHFGALTGIDSYDHASNVMDFGLENKYNIILECAPSLQQGLIGVDTDKLNEANYNTQYYILSVGDLISSIAIHKRYELDINNGGKPGETKLTDLKRHNESYLAVEQTLRNIDSNDVSIYRRGTEKEGRMPVKISKDDMTLQEKIDVFNKERKDSNNEYSKNGFREEYEGIKQSMDNRNAPTKQVEQLKAVYGQYANYIKDNLER